MESRKLIGFGTSSHVISLPKKWLTKHGLEKGDLIYLHENGENELSVLPTRKEIRRKQDQKIIDITGKDITRLQREIVSAYIKDYNILKITGKGLPQKRDAIKKVISGLMAIEVIEEDDTKIVARDFVNVEDISVHELIRKMDLAVRSTFMDMVNIKTKKDVDQIISRNQAINRLKFLAVRVMRRIMEQPPATLKAGTKPSEILTAWDTVHNLKRVSGINKRIAKILYKGNQKVSKDELLEIYKNIEESYLQTMKAFYKNDTEGVYTVSERHELIAKLCNKYVEENWGIEYVSSLIEIFRELSSSIHRMGRRFYS